MVDVQIFGSTMLSLIAVLIGLFGSDAIFFWVQEGARWKSVLIYTPLTWLSASVCVAAMLDRWGTTPGKILFGLRVRSATVEPVSFGRAFRREALLLVYGVCFTIPVANLFGLVSSFNAVEEGRRTRWDEKTDLFVEARSVSGGWPIAGIVLGTVIVIGSWVWHIVEVVIAAAR